MRCAIALAALVAVSLAAPLKKPEDSGPVSGPEATTEGAEEKPILPEETKEQPAAEQSISGAREQQRIEDHSQENSVVHQNENHLPSPISELHPVEHPVLQVQDPHTNPQEKPLEGVHPQVVDVKPGLPLPPLSEPHHIQEHGINERPDRPLLSHPILPGHHKPEESADSDEELDSGEIAFLQALGALAVNFELQLLQELEKELELDQHEHRHSHEDHSLNHEDGHQHSHYAHNKDAGLPLPCDCHNRVAVVPEQGRPLNH